MKPEDLRVQIPRAFRGYDTKKVDQLLRRASEELIAMSKELSEALAESDRIRAELEGIRGDAAAIKEALISAQKMAEVIRADTQRRAQQMLEEARLRAEQLQQELQARTNDLRFELEKLSLDKQRFLSQFRAMLEQYLVSIVEARPASPNGHPISIADSMSGSSADADAASDAEAHSEGAMTEESEEPLETDA